MGSAKTAIKTLSSSLLLVLTPRLCIMPRACVISAIVSVAGRNWLIIVSTKPRLSMHEECVSNATASGTMTKKEPRLTILEPKK